MYRKVKKSPRRRLGPALRAAAPVLAARAGGRHFRAKMAQGAARGAAGRGPTFRRVQGVTES